MKILFKAALVVVICMSLFSCRTDDDTPPTPLNTDVFFKYSLDNGVTFKEITFYNYDAKFHNKIAPDSDTFAFDIEGSPNFVEKVSGQFFFPSDSFATFLTNPVSTTYPWSYPNYGTNLANASTFFFMDSVSPNPLFISLDSSITCTITEYPSAINDYIAFDFSGNYIDATDPSITGMITGSARLQRGLDRID
ncbi:hypothetical protein [Nonlabens sp. Asnod3-A02]|uniref:hypothetical protein n=1 Tax=Nonlabens sp. Asnod3-A02 TaxID=3160579 RepID=UPI00386E3704